MNNERTTIQNTGVYRVKSNILIFLIAQKFFNKQADCTTHLTGDNCHLAEMVGTILQEAWEKSKYFSITQHTPANSENLEKFKEITDSVFDSKEEIVKIYSEMIAHLHTHIHKNDPNLHRYLIEPSKINETDPMYFLNFLRSLSMAQTIVSSYGLYDRNIVVSIGAKHLTDGQYKGIKTILKENYPTFNADVRIFELNNDFNLEIIQKNQTVNQQ